MKQKTQSKKEIHLLIFVFIFIGILGIGTKYFENYMTKIIANTTTDMFEHPLKVSNAALTIQVDVYKIHRDMKDVVLSSSESRIIELTKEIEEHEKRVYKNFAVIEKNILGEEGLALQKKTKQLFESWKPIRNEVIELMSSSKTKEAIDITQGKGAKHVLKLESAALELYNYAQNKAIDFKNKSESGFEKLKIISFSINILFLLIFASIGFYVINRITKFIYKNEHLKGVLSVIRDVNQLIVREKNPQKMIQESCNILISTGVYRQVWIVTYNDDGKTEYFATTDIENIDMFKEKIKSGWIPYCIKKTKNIKKSYSFIEDTLSECSSCPLAGLYDDKSAFNIQLKYNNKVYGYLTLSLEKTYIENHDELALLDEVAGDIAYALYNIRTEEQLIAQEERYRFVIEGTQDGLWDWNLVNNTLYYSARWKEMLGYSDHELENSFKTWEELMNPADKEQASLDIQISQKSKTGLYSNIHRLKHKNGSWVWINARGKTIFNEDGEAVRMIGSHTDITQQKQMEEKIINEEKRLSDLLNNLNVGVVVHASDTTILYNNPMASKLLGLDDIDIESALATDEQWTFVCEDNTPMELEKYPVNVILSTKKSLHNMVMGIVHKNSSGSIINTVWVLVEGFPIFNNENEIIEIIISFSDITERKLAEQKLQFSHDLLYKLTKNVPGAIYQYRLFTDGHASFPYASNGIAEIYEVEPKDVVEDAQPVFNILHPDDLNMVATSIQDSAQSMNDWSLQYRVNLPKKGVRWLEGFSKPEKLEDGSILWHGYIHDITEKKHAFELLKQNKHELEIIIQEAPNPIMVHNEDGEILLLNKVWEKLTGYSYDKINTIEKWTEKAYGKEMPTIKKYIDNLYELKHAVNEGEYSIITNSGEIIIWQFSSAPLGIIDGKRTVISSAMDITELKKKDEMLISQSRLAAMGEMIGMIAHQWRQPIAGIAMDANNMLLDIALNDFDINKAEEYSISIIDQTEHLSKTIDDFRNFFKPDKTLATVKLKDIIEETYAIVKDSLKNNTIEFKASYDSDTKVEAYPRELMQVFVNIINNAKDSLVANKIADAVITVKVYDDDEYVNTEVCDNGVGIAKEILPKIFDPYFTTKDEKTGTGLGLYMSKMIIEEHLKGKIEVLNEDRAVCFKIRLPLIKSHK